jgi:hypothetical protein
MRVRSTDNTIRKQPLTGMRLKAMILPVTVGKYDELAKSSIQEMMKLRSEMHYGMREAGETEKKGGDSLREIEGKREK